MAQEHTDRNARKAGRQPANVLTQRRREVQPALDREADHQSRRQRFGDRADLHQQILAHGGAGFEVGDTVPARIHGPPIAHDGQGDAGNRRLAEKRCRCRIDGELGTGRERLGSQPEGNGRQHQETRGSAPHGYSA